MNKLKLLFAAMLLLASFGAKAQQAEQNPNYYIMGDYEIQNGKHYLRNVETRGITIDGQNYIPVVEGHFGLVESSDGRKGELTRFSFDKAKSNECDLDKGFYLQYLLEIGNEKEWVDEKEYLQGSGTGYSQKDMLVMLVLDYSTSMLRNDFISKMKEAAINFINTLATASPDGNVRVGIIAFSGKSQTQEFQIKNLDRNTKYEMDRFIRSVQPGINTAYYYSIKRAVSMLEDYSSRSNLSRDNFNGACVVSFTDGLDNESADGENELSYIYNELLNKSIMGNTIEFYSIGFTGAEDFSGLQKKKFEEVIVKTATDANHSFNSRDIATIEGYFGDIARKLTDRWKIINLYTPQGHNGKKVRWVLRCGEPRPQPKPLPLPEPEPERDARFFLGFGGGIGYGTYSYSYQYWSGYYRDYYGNYYDQYSWDSGEDNEFVFSPTVDFAWGLSNRSFIGAHMGMNFDTDFEMGITVVPEYIHRFHNNSAIMAGIGYRSLFDFDYSCADIRFGFKTKKAFFLSGDIYFGDSFGMMFGIGWGFFGGGN